MNHTVAGRVAGRSFSTDISNWRRVAVAVQLGPSVVLVFYDVTRAEYKIYARLQKDMEIEKHKRNQKLKLHETTQNSPAPVVITPFH